MSKWPDRFMALAEHVATWSKDPSTKVGCVIVDKQNRVVSVGFNGFPRGIKDFAERYNDKETKYLFVAHAERNALDNAPLSVEGCTLYSPLLPCNECAKSIIQKGITKVVSYEPEEDRPHLQWEITKKMFLEAEVQLYLINKTVTPSG
jgi:dCMP deaminase